MKKIQIISLAAMLLVSMHKTLPTLNNFGISDIFPTKSDDNNTFDQRIQEEMLGGKQLNIHGRHVTNLKLQDILNFIQKIDAYFEHLLNTQNHNPHDFKIAQLALIDVQKAKKMLRPQDVSADDEYDLRVALGAITTKINGYFHDDNVEPEDYLQS
jgi:hypothetical protein